MANIRALLIVSRRLRLSLVTLASLVLTTLGQAGEPSLPEEAAYAANGSLSSDQSSAYARALSVHIRKHIVWKSEFPPRDATCEVEASMAPDGTVRGRKVIRQTGADEWCETVLRAIDKAGPLPKDPNGRVPKVMSLSFHNH